MHKVKKIQIIVWANIIFFVYVVLALIGGVISRNMSQGWSQMEDVRSKYDLFYGVGFSSLGILIIVGLLLRKEWGRVFAIAFCFVLFFSHFIMRLGVYLYYKFTIQQSFIVVDPDAIVISVFSFLFIILLSRKNVKSYYLTVNKNHLANKALNIDRGNSSASS